MLPSLFCGVVCPQHQLFVCHTATAQACGNTFATLNPELSPKVSLSTHSISFPPCHPGKAVHQTMCLSNHGDTPVHFAFSARAGSSSSGHQHAGAAASRLSAAAATGASTSTDGGSRGSSSSGGGSQKAGLVAAGGAWFGQFAVLPVQGVLEPKGEQLVSALLCCTLQQPTRMMCFARCICTGLEVPTTTSGIILHDEVDVPVSCFACRLP